MNRCVATTKNHTQCTRKAKPNQIHCWQHMLLVDISNADVISGDRPSNGHLPPGEGGSGYNGPLAARRPMVRSTFASSPREAPPRRVAPLSGRWEGSHVLSSTGAPMTSFVYEGLSASSELTYKEIITYAKERRLSIKGAHVNIRNRVMQSMRRGNVSYVDIIGNSHKVSKDTFLQYGQEINGLIMGEGELQIERQVYDPSPKLMSRAGVSSVSVIPIDTNVKISYYCLPIYRQDPITQEDLSEISDLQMIYADSNKRCYYLPSILSMWENSFTFYDTTSFRVVPSYPKDIHGGYMDPGTVILVYHTARVRKIDLSPYPLLGILVSNEQFIYDIHRFINHYEELIAHYDRLATSHREDLGLWNRRDLLAYDLLRQLYQRHHIPFNGCRKYINIKSGPGRNGTQIFYQAILVAFFVSKDYGLTFDVDDKGNPQELKWIYDRKNHNIFAKPLYRINNRGTSCLYDYEMLDLLRPFVINPLPIT
jgi:hypothetical protein